ncbi:MAG TPA: translocation/assembly module TamB domain-containing protein [Candidatus Sulfotelmatobacter sp.]|nr:translocation/assembly module TamB domain-containing protein [Candidatus Sulfotelmatobacter sp.]
MKPAGAKPARWWKLLLAAGGVLVLSLIAGLWYTTTDSFQNYVHRRVVSEIERMTGGRARIGKFHVVPFRLQVEIRDITVHGKEAADDIPLLHADSLVGQVKVISFLRTQFGFQSLTLERPTVHVIIAPDGSATNIPAIGKLPTKSGPSTAEQLFALSIDHLSVHNGELIWADRKIPLNFDVQNANVQMDYSFLHGRYESHLSLAKVDTAIRDLRPFSWMTTLDFSLAPTFVDIKSIRWNSGRSSVEASGRITNFHDPHVDGSYDAKVHLGELAAILRRNNVREGTAEFKGNGHWSLQEFTTAGTLALRDLVWQDDQIALKKVSATGDYSVTDEQIKLAKLQGKLLGGAFTGDAEVQNWLRSVPYPAAERAKKPGLPEIGVARPAKKEVRAKVPGVQTGSLHLRVRDISVSEAAASLDTSAHPLDGFHPAGVASGSVDADWKGRTEDADVTFNFDVVPPGRPAIHELPTTAHVQGRYLGINDSLELAQFSLLTPDSKIVGTGTLATSSKLHLSVSTSNLEEWRPLVKALGGPTDLPFRVDGNATFSGAAGGSFSSPTIAGTLVAEDFEFTVPATSRTPEKPVHWDSLGATVQFSMRELSLHGGSLRRGDTSADFEFGASLQKGKLTENSPFSVRVNLHNVDVASTAALADLDYPISGTADVSLQLSGTRAHPEGHGHIRAINGAAYSEEIENFDADLRFGGAEAILSNIHLTHLGAEVTGDAMFSPSTNGFRLDLEGKNFDLARVRQIHLEELPIEGCADFTLQASGTLDAPVIGAGVHVRNLTLDRELTGDLFLDATTKNRELLLTGHSQFPKGRLTVDGTVGMQGDYPAHIAAHLDHMDLDALWRAYLGDQLTGHSSVAGTVTMAGPLRYTRQWRLEGDATDVSVDVEYAKLHNQGPLRFTYADRTLLIPELHLVGEGTDVTGHGTIYYAEGHRLDMAADGQVDLRLLGGISPNLTAGGQATVHMILGGTVADPLPQGTIEIKNGTANYAGIPSGLSEMNGTLLFTRDRINIEHLTTRAGGGTLEFKGEGTNYNQQLHFSLTAIGKDVRLRYPPGVSSMATAELHWAGTKSSSTISGDVLVTKLAVTPGFDFSAYLERSRQSSAVTPANSPLYNVKLDIAVRTAPELQMKTTVARLSGDADLKLRGSVARPSVLGRADILEGDATFNGIKFRLERGDITFANPVAIEPQVNLQATTHVRNYDLDVTVTGTPDRLNVNYRSEPPLPKSDIIALLALGRTSEESEQLQQQSGQTLFSDEATSLIINQAINSAVGNRMQKLFGVSRIKIDPQGLTTETNPAARGPQITIEQEFANNLSLTYSTNVSQSAQQIIQGEYYFNRNLSVLGTRDQNGVVSFDVRMRRRKK